MNLEAYREQIEDVFENMGTPELVSAWNSYCSESDRYDDMVYENDEYDLDTELEGRSPYDILCRAYYGDFNLRHDYFWWNGYGNLVSFNFADDEQSPIYIPEMVDYVIDRETDLDVAEIADILNYEDGEFEESVQRKRPHRRKK